MKYYTSTTQFNYGTDLHARHTAGFKLALVNPGSAGSFSSLCYES